MRGAFPAEQTAAAPGQRCWTVGHSDRRHRARPRRRFAAQRARRLLIEYPVVYFSETDAETSIALRQPTLAEDIARLTGLPVERRAEGIMLVDTTGHFTDKRFPGRGGAVNRTAGLILAKIADLREDPDRASSLHYLLPTDPGEEHADLLSRIDMALPQAARSKPWHTTRMRTMASTRPRLIRTPGSMRGRRACPSWKTARWSR
ncbi:DUF2398 family protein [Streptomyces zhihengii]